MQSRSSAPLRETNSTPWSTSPLEPEYAPQSSTPSSTSPPTSTEPSISSTPAVIHGVNHFVLASSSSVYGVNKKVPFAENDLIERTISPYAATKLSCEQICSNYANLFDIRCSCLRFFTVYGPRQRPDLAIAKFTQKILQGEPIDRYGDGSTARDYTYVEDIISGVVSAIKYDAKDFDIFNLGGSATTTLTELITMLEKTIGKKAIINQMPDQPGDVPRTYADVSKAEQLLGYQPNTPIAKGLEKYVQWFRENHPDLG